MTLTIEAIVREGSKIVNKSVEDINRYYDVIVLSSQRKKDSQIERVNPKPQRKIKEQDRLEFRGKTKKVMKLFKECENP